ncbi:hypothetical protein SLEP1_g24043 [Rubroshorea leprosula]|uniref:Uncharacterized protein n=1 Tax=Rubroshorea leprosula TaxID=152421 RepID=A0AAV5JKK7_9ROSI|nr:hypothetical protein SLEP1_g24043 [Rubroshorea leprosula]
MHSPSEIHFKAAKRILRYVKGTTDFGVLYKRSTNVKLIGFTNSDWAGLEEDMKSTSGQCFSIGSGVISWSSKKQDLVAKSTAEAEYIVTSLAADQAVWFRKLMNDLKQPQIHPTELFCDNLSAVAIVKNPILHDDQIADIFTKGLHKFRFETLRDKLGMSSISVKEEYLEAKKKKHKKAKTEENMDFPGREQVKFGEVVEAPPKLVAVPKIIIAFKMKTAQDASKERLRLQAIEAYRNRKGWTSRPGAVELPPALAS